MARTNVVVCFEPYCWPPWPTNRELLQLARHRCGLDFLDNSNAGQSESNMYFALLRILAEGAIALSVTLSGGALFAS